MLTDKIGKKYRVLFSID